MDFYYREYIEDDGGIILKIRNKFLIILLLFVFLLSSCVKEVEIQDDINQFTNDTVTELKGEKKSKYEFSTIADTQISLDKIGPRLIGTEGNYLLVEALKEYLEDFPDAETVSQLYGMNLYDKYSVSVTVANETIRFDSYNSICKLINDGKFNESVIITDSLEDLDKLKCYIFITDTEKLIEASKEYSNVCLSLLAVDKVYLGQNAIKVRNNIPTVMSINRATAQELLAYMGQDAELKIEASEESFDLENLYVLIKGKDSSDAIVITSHIDTTTALGDNYSKGAIDNGSGVTLNLDLFRKAYDNENQSDYDLIFAFVNSEEGFLTRSSSGSMQLSASLSFKYRDMININLDCLGEKDIDLLSYGYDGNINGKKLTEIVNNQDIGKFNLEIVDYFISDNLSFENAIYFYNFDYHGEDRIIHTERDIIDAVDIGNLENISDILFNVLIELLKLPKEELLI